MMMNQALLMHVQTQNKFAYAASEMLRALLIVVSHICI